MNIKITPKKLNGTVKAPPSKSVSHRVIMAAMLASGKSIISNIGFSEDIKATLDAAKALGAKVSVFEDKVEIEGVDFSNIPQKADIDCRESGSTLRFFIPITSALGVDTTYKGKGKLPQRPITPYLECFADKDVTFNYQNTMPFSVSGKLTAGEYRISGDVSSQFITGLLYALPILKGDSKIILTSKLESESYVNITLDVLAKFGILVDKTDYGYLVYGNQTYKPLDIAVEGDFSNSAFLAVMGILSGEVIIENLDENSSQGDKAFVDILKQMGADIHYKGNNLICRKSNLVATDINAEDIPDLVPILSVAATFAKGKTVISGARRLKIKESDRLAAMEDGISKLGGKIKAFDDGLIIDGAKNLLGGEVDSYNDHRIAMSMAVASINATSDVVITDAMAVTKSYPNFYEEYKSLGGVVDVI